LLLFNFYIMKTLFLIFTLLAIPLLSNAQEFRVPKNYQLEEKEDYDKYQDDFLQAVNWLFKHSVTDDTKKRKKVTKFVTDWVAGSPKVTVELNYDVFSFIAYNDLKVLFMGAWATNAIKNNAYGDVLNNSIYSVKAIIDYYKKFNGDLITVKSLEKFIKLQRKHKLESYIKKKLHYD